MKTFQHHRLYSFEDFDFDYFFEASLNAMDNGTYPWPKDCTTKKQKKKIIKDQYKNMFKQNNFFGYMGFYDDEYPISAIIGTKVGKNFYGALSLVTPNKEGTKSWVYNPEVLNNEKEFIYSQGIRRFYGLMPKGSVLRETLEIRHNQDFKYTKEHPLLPPGSKLDDVELYLRYELKKGWKPEDFASRVEYKPKKETE